MRLTCNREKLLAAVSAASSVAPARPQKEILGYLKLVVGEVTMILATDMENFFSVRVEGVAALIPGEVLLPTQRITRILRECPAETIEINVDGLTAVVVGGGSEWDFPTADPMEYPGMVPVVDGPHHLVSAQALLAGIKRTIFATDASSSRYALGGLLFDMTAGPANLIGTDGRRLAVYGFEAKQVGGHETGPQSIVTSKAANVLLRTVPAKGEMKISFSPNDVIVETETVTLKSRLLEGRYPNWKTVIPKVDDWHADLEIPAGVLASVVRQASIMANEETRGLDFQVMPGTLQARGATAETGKSNIKIPVAFDGEEVVVRLDYGYVGDFLAVQDPADQVHMKILSSTQSVLMTAPNYNYVVMPMAIER